MRRVFHTIIIVRFETLDVGYSHSKEVGNRFDTVQVLRRERVQKAVRYTGRELVAVCTDWAEFNDRAVRFDKEHTWH